MKQLTLVSLISLFVWLSGAPMFASSAASEVASTVAAPVTATQASKATIAVAAGQAQEGLTLDVHAGIDSFAKTSLTLPLRVTIANQGPALNATIQIVNSNTWDVDPLYTHPISLPNQSRKQTTLFLPYRDGMKLSVQLIDEGEAQPLAEKRISLQTLQPEEYLVGVVASNGSLLNGLAGLNAAAGGRVAVAHLQPNELPETIQGWSALDLLVLNDIDTTQLTETQRGLLSHWLHGGGKLLLGGGPNAAQTLGGLTALLPFTDVEIVNLPHPLRGLETFNNEDIEDRGPYIGARLLTPSSQDIWSTGAVLVLEDEFPLLTVSTRGAGQIIYVALDLSLAPMDTLASQTRFMKQLLGTLAPRDELLFDYTFADRMKTSLATLPGFALPRPTTIGLYLLIYLLAVGPLNYLILGRLKKREWTWLTLPAIILLFCGAVYWRGFQLNGGQSLLRQMTVVHGQANSSSVHIGSGESLAQSLANSPLSLPQNSSAVDANPRSPIAEYGSYVGVVSSSRTAYEIELADTTLVQPLTNLYQNNDSFTVIYGAPTVISNLQGDIGAMPAVLARGQLPTPDISAQLIYEQQSKQVRGTIINNTGKVIEGAYLVLKTQGFRIGTIPTGETAIDGRLSTSLRSNDLYSIQGTSPDDDSFKWASRNMAVKTLLHVDPNWQYNAPSQQTAGLQNIHLIGWQEGSPVEISMPDQRYRQAEETLFIIRL